MRIEDRLDKGTRNKLNILRGTRKKKNPKKKYQEDFSERDIKDLMGVNRATYRRYKGALRQR